MNLSLKINFNTRNYIWLISLGKILCMVLGLTIIVIISCQSLRAQSVPLTDSSAPFGIALKAKAFGDSIVLRWAPTDGIAWGVSRRKGYTVYRITYGFNGKVDTTLLTPTPILPWTLEKLNTLAAGKDPYVAMAAQALYGKDFTMTSKAPRSLVEEIEQQSDAYNLRFFVAMQAADLSKKAAEVMGFRLVDKAVTKGMYYGYIVQSDTASEGEPLKAGITKLVNAVPAKPLTPQGLEGMGNDMKIELQWNRQQKGGFDYFFIQRSIDGGKTYQLLTPEPYFSSYNPALDKGGDSLQGKVQAVLRDRQVFFDSIPENYVDYYYRIAGIDPFGDTSPYSEPIKVHGVDRTPPSRVIVDSVANIFLNHIFIRWRDPEKAGDLVGYFVARGSEHDGPFYPVHDKLLPKSATSFIDTTASAGEKIFYVVASVDTAGNYAYSMPRMGLLTDSTPPAAPTGLKGMMDAAGMIVLQWDANKEKDMSGYKVYYSYNPTSNFIQVTQYPVKSTLFVDSISPTTLDRHVYYKIVALDKQGNHSDYSEAVDIQKPVVTPPSAPVAKSIYSTQNAIITEWIGSSSEGVLGYEIYRKKSGDAPWDTLTVIQQQPFGVPFQYEDSTACQNQTYIYAAATVDSTGPRSKLSAKVSGYLHNGFVLPRPDKLKAVYQKEKRSIVLHWAGPSLAQPYYIIIHRGVGDGILAPWRSLQVSAAESVDGSTKDGKALAVKNSFEDIGVTSGKHYQYAIEFHEMNKDNKAVGKSSGKSPLSQVVNVQTN